jgi:bifunctional DNA-binding transcriptional regulator/antitoxin component of YhaV-PrlF toxin-antitoxin module
MSETYRVEIPKSVRSAQNWKPGMTFALVPKGAGVLLVPVPDREELFGSMARADPSGYRDRPAVA